MSPKQPRCLGVTWPLPSASTFLSRWPRRVSFINLRPAASAAGLLVFCLIFWCGVLPALVAAQLCNTDALSSSLQQSMQTLRATYSSPINALRPVTMQMHALLGSDWSMYTPLHGRWLPRLDELTPIFEEHQCAYDPDPARTIETFIGGYAYTSEWNSECAYQQQVVQDAGGAEINPVDCIKPANNTLTLRCVQEWPACPDPVARLTDPWPFQQWNNGSTPYCPLYCLQPARFNNSLIDFLYQYTNPFVAQIEDIAEAEAAKGTKINLWYWMDKVRKKGHNQHEVAAHID